MMPNGRWRLVKAALDAFGYEPEKYACLGLSDRIEGVPAASPEQVTAARRASPTSACG